jgi:alpha-L-rhamnosidase
VIHPQPDGDMHLVIDFGREIIGYVELDLSAAEGAIIDANLFEVIDETGIFWTTNLRNSFRYICREGDQHFVSHRRRGFRYLSLTLRNMARPLLLHQVSAQISTYPVEARGAFRCSDSLLNTIWETAAYTVKLCMLDTYTDCPAYEQAFWVGDARNAALVNQVAFGAHELTAHCIALTALSLSDEINAIKPAYIQRDHLTTSHVVSGWFNEIPMWTFLWVWMIWEHYLYTGDVALLASHYPAVKLCLQRCERFLSARDILAIPDVWNLVDWAAMDLEDEGEVTANTALMARSLDLAAEMATVLSQDTDAEGFKGLAQRLRVALNSYTWSDVHQGYVDTLRDADAYAAYCQKAQGNGLPIITIDAFMHKQRVSECTNTLMLLCRCVPSERYEATLRFTLAARDGKFRGSGPHEAHLGNPNELVTVGSPWFLFFTLETLFGEGYADVAINILRDQWGRMIEKGATTFWEMFPAESSDGRPIHWSRSLCHGWSAAPTYFLSSQVLGVIPLVAGYRKIRIQPQSLGLTWAEGRIPTIHGDIFVRWRKGDDGQLLLTYHVPGGVEVVGTNEQPHWGEV